MKQLDKYYTNYNIIKICCKIFKKYIKIFKNDLIIEPSAGNGAFYNCIKNYNNIMFDIKPENKLIIKKDFLKLNYKKIKKNYNNIHAIGNPPFGKKSSLAIKFIKKCCKFCDSFSFILPKSFNKYFLQKSIPLNFHLIKSYNLPIDSFGHPPIKCVFQIWKKKNYNRKNIIKKILPNNNYKFVSNYNDADIAIRRVGSKSGYIYYNNLNNKNSNTHYFIKIFKKYKKFNKLKLYNEKNNTLAAFSISKMDIIKKLNNIYI
jgi:hypothetical protein|tara:strand:+ start:4533 stop:5312 length:780 start_codon:yes stop_codon:yes gene_type:complete